MTVEDVIQGYAINEKRLQALERTVDPEIGKDIDEVENISSILSVIVEQRTSLGLSQRELTVRPTKPTI